MNNCSAVSLAISGRPMPVVSQYIIFMHASQVKRFHLDIYTCIAVQWFFLCLDSGRQTGTVLAL